MTAAVIELPATARSVSQARHFVTDLLDSWGIDSLGFAAAQTVSELATNAVLHARTKFAVRVLRRGSVVRIEVSDGSTALPRTTGYGPEATTGRGLALVAQLSRRWGIERTGTGKVVWCEVEPDQAEQDGTGRRSAGASSGRAAQERGGGKIPDDVSALAA